MLELDQTLSLLAGGSYMEMIERPDAARDHLTDPDPNVRVAALVICVRNWNWQADRGFLDQCRQMAATDRDDSVRAQAIAILGTALGSSKDVSTSRFLADLAREESNPEPVRRAAFVALREIQEGFSESVAFGQLASVVNEMITRHPDSSEIRALQRSLREGSDQIDWEFVNRHASASRSSPSTPTGRTTG